VISYSKVKVLGDLTSDYTDLDIITFGMLSVKIRDFESYYTTLRENQLSQFYSMLKYHSFSRSVNFANMLDIKGFEVLKTPLFKAVWYSAAR
jgi:hypothetical protein